MYEGSNLFVPFVECKKSIFLFVVECIFLLIHPVGFVYPHIRHHIITNCLLQSTLNQNVTVHFLEMSAQPQTEVYYLLGYRL